MPRKTLDPDSPGSIIRALRDAKGWRAVDLAEKSGVGVANLFNIEQGKGTAPRPSTKLAIARAFQVSVTDIWKPTEANVSSPGGRIRQLRTTLGLTIEELAEKVGTHEVNLARIESGVTELPQHLLRLRIAHTLGVEEIDIWPKDLTEQEQPPKGTPGAVIWAQRIVLGLTQGQLAERAEVYLSTIWKLEHGVTVQGEHNTRKAVAKALSLTERDIWGDIPPRGLELQEGTPGWIIRRRRLELDLTDEQLAEQAGIPRPYLSQIQRNEVQLPGEVFRQQIALTLGMKPWHIWPAIRALRQPKAYGNRPGSVIRKRRLELELRQLDLARHAGVSASLISNLEHDKELQPRKRTRLAIAQALGMQAADIWPKILPLKSDDRNN